MRYLVTGGLGFIGSHLCERLLKEGHSVLIIDNLCGQYMEDEYIARLDTLREYPKLSFYRSNVRVGMPGIFAQFGPDIVIHLAALTGVRASTEEPARYLNENVLGMLSVLEACVLHPVQKLVYASSSSVYGLKGVSTSTYAASKAMTETLAAQYQYLHGIPCVGLRFFTVYGPDCRRDMAPYIFVDKAFKEEPAEIFGSVWNRRNFTYIDDIVEGILLATEARDGGYDLGYPEDYGLATLIECVRRASGKNLGVTVGPARREDLIDNPVRNPLPGFTPKTDLYEGICSLVDWYRKEQR